MSDESTMPHETTVQFPPPTNRVEFLAQLRSDPSELVETLRCAASLLTGDGPAEAELNEAQRARVSHQVAATLLDAAQRLCDHCRTSGDGRCRYCETLMGVGEPC